ncbi:MAG: FecR domain-containing protein [Chitinophagaceae bacterium]|nr:FecR domain-containing protein [Chitinophagaceae bacterium]
MDISSYTTEDFVCDESFRNYCSGSDRAAVQFWKAWIRDHPEKTGEVREAERLISILNARQGNVQEQLEQLKDGILRFDLLKTTISGESEKAQAVRWRYVAGIAAAFLLLAVAFWLLTPGGRTVPGRTVAQEIRSGREPRKTVVLPDGSVVTLHSNTTLTLVEGFGNTGRELTLSGEALFDIAHGGQHPFIVHTSAVDVEVLGTLFNLNAYPQAGFTETSLFRGKIAVSLKDHPEQKVILTPSQKSVVFNSPGKIETAPGDSLLKKASLSVDPVNHKAKEIAWVRSRIKIEDEPLEAIAGRLQAWYGIPIVFADDETKGYRYSGTFESETVVKALEALQLSYPFNFRVEKDTIIIGK